MNPTWTPKMAAAAPTPDDGSELTFQAWRLLESESRALLLSDSPIQPILDFRAAADRNPTTREERTAILDQAALLFHHLYPHLPFKLDRFDFAKPVDFIDQHIRTQLDDDLDETRFHSFVLAAFSLVRDAHTSYALPSPYKGAVAFLPFQMRHYSDAAGLHFVVTKVMNSTADGGFGHPFFDRGAEILAWGDEPIVDHIFRAAGRLAGGNESALLTRASIGSTIRPLTFVQFPFPEEMPAATVFYRPAHRDETRAIRLPWGVGATIGSEFPSGAFSVNSAMAAMTGWDRVCHDRDAVREENKLGPSMYGIQGSLLPKIFDCQYTHGPRTRDPIDIADLVDPDRPDALFGYLRIKSFGDGSTATIDTVAEFQRLLTLMDQLSPDGLVLDLRGNGGGDLHAAEQMLQMLTPRRITPARFHLANTPAVLRILRAIRGDIPHSAADDRAVRDAGAALKNWLHDADRSPLPDGGRLTSGQPLTPPDSANDVGQIYQGRVVLLIDALTYSAADIFAGGFQDHDIGLIVGSDATTGGGGADVWNHDDLLKIFGPLAGIPLQKLPRDTGIKLAFRRSARVERFDTQPIEDLGVSVDIPYTPPSADDVVDGGPGMIRAACRILTALSTLGPTPFRGLRPGVFRIDAVTIAFPDAGPLAVGLQTKNIASLKFFFDDATVPAATVPVAGDGAQSFPVPPAAAGPLATLRIEGYAGADLVAARVVSLLPPDPPPADNT
jgi:hypothetical protein